MAANQSDVPLGHGIVKNSILQFLRLTRFCWSPKLGCSHPHPISPAVFISQIEMVTRSSLKLGSILESRPKTSKTSCQSMLSKSILGSRQLETTVLIMQYVLYGTFRNVEVAHKNGEFLAQFFKTMLASLWSCPERIHSPDSWTKRSETNYFCETTQTLVM